jgi:hypothetical protein
MSAQTPSVLPGPQDHAPHSADAAVQAHPVGVSPALEQQPSPPYQYHQAVLATEQPQLHVESQYPTPPAHGDRSGSFGMQNGPSPHAPYTYGPPPKTPGVGLVIGLTAIIGVFGVLAVLLRLKEARDLNLPTARYWVAYFGTLCVVLMATIVFWMAMEESPAMDVPPAPPSESQPLDVQPAPERTVMDAPKLETELMQADYGPDGGASTEPKSAVCVPAEVRTDGSGTYQCQVDFADKVRESYTVTVGSDGYWLTD